MEKLDSDILRYLLVSDSGGGGVKQGIVISTCLMRSLCLSVPSLLRALSFVVIKGFRVSEKGTLTENVSMNAEKGLGRTEECSSGGKCLHG